MNLSPINKAPADGAGFLSRSFFLEPPPSPQQQPQSTQESTAPGLARMPPRPEQQRAGDVACSFLCPEQPVTVLGSL